jgi:Ser/Thr protein kinase RdoA (MazF antagonist)
VPVAPLVALLDGPVPSLVLEWLDGVVPLSELDAPEAWRSAGQTLRRLHELPTLRRRSEPFPVFMRHWFELEMRELVACAAVSADEAAAALAKAAEFETILARTPLVWAHVDCQAAHFLLNPDDNSVAAVIDWADACEDAPDMDFAVLTLFGRLYLDAVLDGYGASRELRDRLAGTLPFYRAVRAAGAHNWLESHGYAGHTWALEEIRAFIA